MKKLFLFPVMLLFALTITACSNSPNGFEEPETEQPETPGNDGDEDNKPEENSMKIKITVGNRESNYKAVVTKMLYLGEYVRDNWNKISNKAEHIISNKRAKNYR